MTAIFVRLLIAALGNAEVQALLIGLLGRAFGPMLDKARADIVAEIANLPAQLLGAAEKPVEQLLHEITGTTDQIAGAVKVQVSPLLDPVGFAKAIVDQMTGQGGQKPPWWPF